MIKAAVCASMIFAKLGYMPESGQTLFIPRSALAGYSKTQLRTAAKCLHSRGINYVLTGKKEKRL